MDGELLKMGRHPFEAQIEPFRYVFLGTDNVYNAMPGPIYSNLRIYTIEEEGSSPGLEKIAGDEQQGNPGDQLVDPLMVRALNLKGEPFENIPVVFEITNGGGRIVEEQPMLTDSNGLASVNWILGSVTIDNKVLAYGDGLPGDSVEFSATALLANELREVSGAGQIGRVAEPLSDSIAVEVLSQTNDPVAGQRR